MLAELISEQMAKDEKEFNLIIEEHIANDLLTDELINYLDLSKTVNCHNKKYIVLVVKPGEVLTQVDNYSDLSENKNYLLTNKITKPTIVYRGILRKKGFSLTKLLDNMRAVVEEYNLDREFEEQEFINAVNAIDTTLPIVIKHGNFYWKFENNKEQKYLYSREHCFGEDIENVSFSNCFLFEHLQESKNKFVLNEFSIVYHEETMIVK